MGGCERPTVVTSILNTLDYRPCTKCSWCTARIGLAWAGRAALEYTFHGYMAQYFTLTYRPGSEPNGYDLKGVIGHYDLNRWLDTRRKKSERAGRPPFHFFAVSEFGSQTHRAHHHVIVLGDYFDVRLGGDPRFPGFTNFTETPWPHGFVYAGGLRIGHDVLTGFDAFDYVGKYLRKDDASGQCVPRIYRGIGLDFARLQALSDLDWMARNRLTPLESPCVAHAPFLEFFDFATGRIRRYPRHVGVRAVQKPIFERAGYRVLPWFDAQEDAGYSDSWMLPIDSPFYNGKTMPGFCHKPMTYEQQVHAAIMAARVPNRIDRSDNLCRSMIPLPGIEPPFIEALL